MNRVILINESQVESLSNSIFSIDKIKNTHWKNGDEIIQYCEQCNLLKLGEGIGRVVYQIDDEHVIKIQKAVYGSKKQNEGEVNAFRGCDDNMKQFLPWIFDWDKNNLYPLWIISEQVLPASYADFKKILDIDFGSYSSSNEIKQMKQDIEDYKKYDVGPRKSSKINLMDFLESYGEGELDFYDYEIKHNRWLNELYHMLRQGIVSYWELEIIDNWGLVMRNGYPTLIILDAGM